MKNNIFANVFNILFRAKKIEKVEYLPRKCGVFLPFIPKVLGRGDKMVTRICQITINRLLIGDAFQFEAQHIFLARRKLTQPFNNIINTELHTQELG